MRFSGTRHYRDYSLFLRQHSLALFYAMLIDIDPDRNLVFSVNVYWNGNSDSFIILKFSFLIITWTLSRLSKRFGAAWVIDILWFLGCYFLFLHQFYFVLKLGKFYYIFNVFFYKISLIPIHIWCWKNFSNVANMQIMHSWKNNQQCSSAKQLQTLSKNSFAKKNISIRIMHFINALAVFIF